MAEVRETVKGDGYAVGSIDGTGSGPGFRKVRRELGVTAFGANVLVLPEGYDAGAPTRHGDSERRVDQHVSLVAHGQVLADLVAQWALDVVLPGAGHFCMEDAPRALTSALAEFLSRAHAG